MTWINSDNLRWVLAAAAVIALIGLWPLIQFVQSLIVKTVAAAICVLLAVGFWTQRTALADCAKQCECSLFGFEVEVPAAARERIQDAPVCRG